jgi:hypothetical protein
MSTDLNFEYKDIQSKTQALQTYTESKQQYNRAQKVNGSSFEQLDSSVQNSLDQVKDLTKSYQKQVKNQFDQLLDLGRITGGSGGNTLKYIRRVLTLSLKNSTSRILEILNSEVAKTIGCDQNTSYSSQTLYISVKSIDLLGLLKLNPNEKLGKVLYEKDTQISPQPIPYSMNRELYDRIQQTDSFNDQYGVNYIGTSNKPLFDIKFVEINPLTGVGGGWFEIVLSNRGTINNVKEFLQDYYSTIKIFDLNSVVASIVNSLSGAISINANLGLVQTEDATKFELIIQRILGLCFDNRVEIDVSGNAKISEYDGIDDSFFEFTDIDLRNIDQKINNIYKGVMQFEECNNISLPVNVDSVLDDLEQLLFVDDNEIVNSIDKILQNLSNNPDWKGLAISGNIQVAIELNFIKLIINGLISGLLTPKILLPIYIMLKSLGQFFMDEIKSFMDFVKKFKKFVVEFVSKIQAIFVEELFKIIKKDIFNLIQVIVTDLVKEKTDKRLIMLLKLIQLIIVVANFISDWRKCKSVIDEIRQLLTVLTSGFIPGGGLGGGGIPLPLLFGSQLLAGYSESRAFIGTIEEMQKIGIPTGPMPDGSPNLNLLAKFAQLKASAREDTENNKVQIAVGPLTITPAGVTLPSTAWGKKF